MQRIFGCAILNIRETASQATQSSQDRRDELDVRPRFFGAKRPRNGDWYENSFDQWKPERRSKQHVKALQSISGGHFEIDKDAEIRQMNLSEKKIAPL